jgi:putative nucleotidyltransferase with HDIG domain
MMMVTSIEEVLDGVEELVSLPAACLRINEMVDDPTTSTDDVSQVITQDPALTARLLRIANSPFYGLASSVDTVARAVTVLGMRQVRDLALATTAVRAFEGIPNKLVSMQSFWEHSIYCALAARTLAEDCLKSRRESVFVAGLLHDVGQLVLYNRLPDLSRQALEAVLDGPEELESQEAERELMGFDHAEVGAELMRRWGLPENLRECVAFHHTPQMAEHHAKEVAIVHIANSIASMAELNSLDLGHAPRIDPSAWEVIGLVPDVIEPTIRGVQAQIADARVLLLGESIVTL